MYRRPIRAWVKRELWAPPDPALAAALQEILRNTVVSASRPRSLLVATLVVDERPIAYHQAWSMLGMDDALRQLVPPLSITHGDLLLLTVPYRRMLDEELGRLRLATVKILGAEVSWMMDLDDLKITLDHARALTVLPRAVVSAPDPGVAQLCAQYGVWLIEDRTSLGIWGAETAVSPPTAPLPDPSVPSLHLTERGTDEHD